LVLEIVVVLNTRAACCEPCGKFLQFADWRYKVE
jgi:hypothetical protein